MKEYLYNNRFLLAGLLLIVAAFVLNVSCYIYDPDDGSTIIYHVLGRNPAIQQPYNYYDSFNDHLLSFLPADYYAVYGVGLAATLLAAIVIYILLIEIALSFTDVSRTHMQAIGLIFLLAVPDFIYLTLSYKSSLVAFALVLCNYYLLIKYVNTPRIALLLGAALLFGTGAAMRWNMGSYGLAIFVDVFLLYMAARDKRWWVLFVWGIFSVAFFLLCLWMSGYTLNKFVETVRWGREYMSDFDMQLKVVAMLCMQLFTPVAILLIGAGLIQCLRYAKSYIRVWLLAVLSLLPYFYVGFNPLLKYMIIALPAMFIVMGIGYMWLYTTWKHSRVAKTAFVIALLLPWFAGIQIHTNETLWGPGFELNQKGGADINKRLDERKGERKLNIGFYDGFCIPTAEGPKPLWGNFYVIGFGKVKQMNTLLGKEVESIIELASREHIDIYTDRGNPVMLAGLCKENYTTHDSSKQAGLATIRRFANGSNAVIIKRFNYKGDITDYEKVKQLVSKRFVAHFTYTSQMAEFIQHAPEHGIEVVGRPGAFSGVFEVQ